MNYRKKAILMVVALFCLNVAMLAQAISLKMNNVSVKEAMTQLKNKSGYSFVYKVGDLDTRRIVSVEAKQLNEAVDQILYGQNVVYEIKGKNIIVQKGQSRQNTSKDNKKHRITGIVNDMNGEPIIGATVKEKGSSNGTATDLDARFSLEVSPDAILEISYIGYQTQDVSVKNRSSLIITLKDDTQALDEVVVVGFSTQKKINLTGAVENVSSDVFENRPVANVTQMLQGAVPNLNISLADGKPNQSASYNIRGVTSIGAGGSALVLIDGVEGDPAMLNPNDIESVSVLKDAASAAIYGSRAPYGVVLITTKDPSKQKDKFTINYTGNFSYETPYAVPDVVDDGYVWAYLFREAEFNYRGIEPTSINKSQPFSKEWLETFRQRKLAGNTLQTAVGPDGKYTYYGNEDYYDAFYKDHTFAQSHNVSISGSNGKISYYTSARLYDYDGLFNYNSDTYRTMNMRTKVSAQVFDWLKISNNIDYTHDKYSQPLGYIGQNEGLVWKGINMEGHPSEPIFNPAGTLTHSGARSVGGLVTGDNWIKRTTKTLKNTTTLNVTLLDNKLRFTGDFSFRTKDFIEDKKTTAVPYSDYEGVIKYLGTPETDDEMSEKVQQTTYISTNVYAEYENTFAGKHYLKALVGYNYEQQDYKAISSERNGLLMPDVENINFAMGDNMSIKSDGNRWRYAGAFFRLNYSYDNRYLFEVNGRYDGSSKFPNNSQWGFFPSASAAWRFSEEKFWKVNPDIISNGKLRVSYGALGNSNVKPYSYLEKFTLRTYSTTGSSSEGRYLDGKAQLRYTLNPDQIPDNIGWETSRTIDAGIDLGFWNNKITLSADYYVRKTVNMYTVGPTLPDTFGASSPKGNYADMSTYGYEISLGYNDSFRLAGKPFSFGVKATLADYHSVIDKYNNPKRDLDDYYVGQRIGEIWGFVCNGLFQSQEEIDAAFDGKGYKNNLMQTSVNYITYPGDMRFEDLNNTGTIDNGANTVDSPGDRKVIGNTEPRYIYTISLSADWNNFFLSAMFDGVGKQNWYPSGESSFWGQYNRPYNQVPLWHLNNYWTKDRPDAYLPRYSGYYNPLYKGTANTRYLQDVSYFRLKNLQFGYNLPRKWIAKAGFSKVSVYFSGENLWSWSPLYRHTKDYDVTVVTKGSDTDLTSGSKGDGFNYPTMRNLSLGISITY